MRLLRLRFVGLLALAALTGCQAIASGQAPGAQALPTGPFPAAEVAPPARGPFVAAANPLALQAGLDVLRRGGSAVDAAVAVQAVPGSGRAPVLGSGRRVLHDGL